MQRILAVSDWGWWSARTLLKGLMVKLTFNLFLNRAPIFTSPLNSNKENNKLFINKSVKTIIYSTITSLSLNGNPNQSTFRQFSTHQFSMSSILMVQICILLKMKTKYKTGVLHWEKQTKMISEDVWMDGINILILILNPQA